jgi:hypothetical protein
MSFQFGPALKFAIPVCCVLIVCVAILVLIPWVAGPPPTESVITGTWVGPTRLTVDNVYGGHLTLAYDLRPKVHLRIEGTYTVPKTSLVVARWPDPLAQEEDLTCEGQFDLEKELLFVYCWDNGTRITEYKYLV